LQVHSVACAVAADGALRLASGSADGTLVLWDPSQASGLERLGHSQRVHCVAFAPDSARLATGGKDRRVLVWDVHTGERQAVLQAPSPVRSVAFAPDGSRLVAGCYDKSVSVWDLAAGTLVQTWESHAQWADVALVAAGQGGSAGPAAAPASVRVGSSGGSGLLLDGRRVLDVGGDILDLALSPDARYVAVAFEPCNVLLCRLPVRQTGHTTKATQ
jgi:WD40 repeat protein